MNVFLPRHLLQQENRGSQALQQKEASGSPPAHGNASFRGRGPPWWPRSKGPVTICAGLRILRKRNMAQT